MFGGARRPRECGFRGNGQGEMHRDSKRTSTKGEGTFILRCECPLMPRAFERVGLRSRVLTHLAAKRDVGERWAMQKLFEASPGESEAGALSM